ncbi:flagellar biosynthesis protein FliQ [Clostridia bacterium]|nr:flagellar biosynthesis protein FliQ [Clostridia bacterium]
MNEDMILDIMRQALQVVVFTAIPPLGCGLIVGVLVSIFQTVTSIQEQTLVFIPKIMAVMISLLFFGSFMASNLKEFMMTIFMRMPELISK